MSDFITPALWSANTKKKIWSLKLKLANLLLYCLRHI